MREYIEAIKANGITSELIGMMIDDHKIERERMLKQYDRYKTEVNGVPILQRQAVEYEDFETEAVKRIDHKVNNRLNNSFDAEIVDTKVGYMFGHAISYDIDKNETSATTLDTTLSDFNLRNNVEDQDSEWGKKASICGYGARFAYIDTEGKERVVNVDPWQTIILGDMTEPEYGLRYYEVNRINAGARNKVWKAEFYDNTTTYYFERNNDGPYQLQKEETHKFDYCPLFGVPNNEELMGDAQKVYSLIDAYDRTLSDASNEIEQYRLAYLVLRGLGMDEEDEQRVRRSGIFNLFDEKDDVSYLTKDINDTLIENHLNRLEENILRFAKSVNFTDESFGNVTGVALRFKLMALENKCITMERKMTAALRYQFKVLCSAWAKRGICEKDDYLKVWFGFKRNLPANIFDEAQATEKLKGQVSEKTRLSLLSFVDDVDYELDEMAKETAERMASIEEYERELEGEDVATQQPPEGS